MLLERWESLLDDTSVWDFSPTVVHGDLVAERLVVTGEEVTAVLDWDELHVGDPAQDLAWLAVGAEPETVEEVLTAYRASRHGAVDDDLLRRAVLHGEMALVRWLLHGVAAGDAEVRDDAHGMLEQLAGWVEAENEARGLSAAHAGDDDEDDGEDEGRRARSTTAPSPTTPSTTTPTTPAEDDTGEDDRSDDRSDDGGSDADEDDRAARATRARTTPAGTTSCRTSPARHRADGTTSTDGDDGTARPT